GPVTEFFTTTHHGPDSDVGIHAAVVTQITDRPAIHAPPGAFQLVDDFHRAPLRRTGDRTARQAGRQQVHRLHALAKLPAHRAHHMLHIGVALDLEQRLRFDTAWPAHPAQVI